MDSARVSKCPAPHETRLSSIICHLYHNYFASQSDQSIGIDKNNNGILLEDSNDQGSASIDYYGPRTVAHHSIPPIPEDRSATCTAQHPMESKQNESPDPHSATTTGTTSTPTSVSNSPTHGEGSKAASGPEFPTDRLRSRPPGAMAHGQDSWPAKIQEDMMAPRYGNSPPPMNDDPNAPFGVSPSEGGRYDVASGFPCAVKLLVSNNVAGSIIGRSGQTISELQSQSFTRIKLSQTGDYYPGSQDRVCLVQGQLENVKGAVRLLLDRLFMLQEHQHSQHLAWQSNRVEGSPPFDFVVRILVPSSSCGMIIGKSGSNIRQMEEVSGVTSVRLSPKDIVDPNYPSSTITAATSERVVTLTGSTLESCLHCVCIILDGMTAHPDICRYTNLTTSYSRLMPDPFATGQQAMRPVLPQEPLHRNEGNLWETNQYGQMHHGSSISKRVSSSPDLSAGFLSHHGPPVIEGRPSPVGAPRDNMPYSPMFGGPASAYSPGRQSDPRMPSQNAGPQMYLNHPHMENPPAATPVPSSVSAPDLLTLQLESMQLSGPPSQHQAQLPLPPQQLQGHQEYPLFPSPPMPAPNMTQPQGFSAQVLVPDNMVGSILGRGGKTLNELQAHSGTRIRISRRGEYMPGTRNRIVSVRGPTAQSVSLAQYMMSQRMILPRTATYQMPPNQAPPLMPQYPNAVEPDSKDHFFHHPDPQASSVHATQPSPPQQQQQNQNQPPQPGSSDG